MRRAGFDVVAAVELNAIAAATYKANHHRTRLFEADVCEVEAKELRKVLGSCRLDLLMGCAPCQGFCSLTRKVRRDDPRNWLVLEMARLVGKLRPEVVMMENVPGLATVGRIIFDDFLKTLRRLGYYPTWHVVQMADYGVPQSRRRLVLLAGRGFGVPFPASTHARVPNDGGLKPWVTAREAIGGRVSPVTFPHATRRGGPRVFDWHVVRQIQPQTRARLKAAQPGKTWLAVDERLRPECHRDGYQGFTNVYGRMAWDEPSPTITSGCTTPAKGRFGHPDRRRTTISVREAALLQTFPDGYNFATDQIDAVCDMIGNAVPPRFARLVGHSIKAALEAHRAALKRAG